MQTTEQVLMEALTLFDDEPEALLTELFHRLTAYRHRRRDEIDSSITDAFLYLAECGYRLDDLDKLDPEVRDLFSDDPDSTSLEMQVLKVVLELPPSTPLDLPAGILVTDFLVAWIRIMPFLVQFYEDEMEALSTGRRRARRSYGDVSIKTPPSTQIYNAFRALLVLARATPAFTSARYAGYRVRVLFQCERCLSTPLPHPIISLVNSVVDLIPTEELVPTLLAGITSWLSRRRFAALLVRVRAAAARKRSHITFTEAMACIDALPFAEPSTLALQRLRRRLLAPHTRSSTYLTIANRVAQLAGTVAQTALYELLPTQSLPNIAGRDSKLAWWCTWLQDLVTDPLTAPAPAVAAQLFTIVTGEHALAIARALTVAAAKLQVPLKMTAPTPSSEERQLMRRALASELSNAGIEGAGGGGHERRGSDGGESARSGGSARSGSVKSGSTRSGSARSGNARAGVLSRMKIRTKPTGPVSGAAAMTIIRAIQAPPEYYELVEVCAELVSSNPEQLAYVSSASQLAPPNPVDTVAGHALPTASSAFPPDTVFGRAPLAPPLPPAVEFEAGTQDPEWQATFPGLQTDQPVIARIPRVHLQHDADARRLVATLQEADDAAAGVAVSAVSGVLRVLQRAITWTPVVGGREEPDATLVVHVGAVFAWTWGAITGEVMEEGASGTSKAVMATASRGATFATTGPRGREPCMFAFWVDPSPGSPGGVFRFLPLAPAEATALAPAVTAVLGHAPCTEKQLLTKIIEDRGGVMTAQASHTLIRRAAEQQKHNAEAAKAAADLAVANDAKRLSTDQLGGIAAELACKGAKAKTAATRNALEAAAAAARASKSPWIAHSSDLHELINTLVFGRKQMDHLDIERLFHSCRVSDDVAIETLSEIRRLWSFATTEPVRVRLLTVVDRLLDPSIMRSDNGSYDSVTNWLAGLESGLDPYKAAQSTRAVHELLQRARRLKQQLVAPIAPVQLGDTVRDGRVFLENATQQGWRYAPGFTSGDLEQLRELEKGKREREKVARRAEQELQQEMQAGVAVYEGGGTSLKL